MKYSSFFALCTTAIHPAVYGSASYLRNYNSNICRNCKFYQPKYDYLEYEQKFAYCKRFGEVDIQSGEVYYDSVYNCRRDERKCGIHGKLYEYDEWKTIKVLQHNINRNSYLFFIVVPTSIICVYSILKAY